MVNIVIVSHSLKLAQGLLDLASQVTQSKVNIAIAAGVDDPENPIGTDAIAVMNAIEEVYSDDGVLVMVDLGSAILSAETALDLMGPIQSQTVKICAAPLVEGCITASVSAASGLPLERVHSEAMGALSAKSQALGQPLQQEESQSETTATNTNHQELHIFSCTADQPPRAPCSPCRRTFRHTSFFQRSDMARKSRQVRRCQKYQQTNVAKHPTQRYASLLDSWRGCRKSH